MKKYGFFPACNNCCLGVISTGNYPSSFVPFVAVMGKHPALISDETQNIWIVPTFCQEIMRIQTHLVDGLPETKTSLQLPCNFPQLPISHLRLIWNMIFYPKISHTQNSWKTPKHTTTPTSKNHTRVFPQNRIILFFWIWKKKNKHTS